MNKIYNISSLSNLTLEDFELEFPKSINKNSFFTKIKYLGNDLIIQAPKSLTKEGIQGNDNKHYCNLKYETNDAEHKQIIEFLNNFRDLCKKLIFSKNNSWFQDSLEEKNLDIMFSKPLKNNNNKSTYFLKLNLEKNFTTYDEKQNECSIDNINNTTSLIPLVNINGIIFDETNFSLDLFSSQIMYFNNRENRCLINLQEENTNNLEKTLTNDLEEIKTDNLEKIIDKSNEVEDNKTKEDEELEEYNLDNIVNLEETIKLKKPNDLYYELYNLAKKKAKLAKKEALNAYLELQKIKEQYNLDVSDSDEELSDDESTTEIEKTNMNDKFDNISSTNSETSEVSELSEISDFSENFDENNK